MKKLNRKETEQLSALLKRAISNSQFTLAVASPYPDDDKDGWKRDGWEFNDMHNGNATTFDSANVEVCYDVEDDEGIPEEAQHGVRDTVTVFVPDGSLCFLAAGVGPEEMDNLLSIRNAMANV